MMGLFPVVRKESQATPYRYFRIIDPAAIEAIEWAQQEESEKQKERDEILNASGAIGWYECAGIIIGLLIPEGTECKIPRYIIDKSRRRGSGSHWIDGVKCTRWKPGSTSRKKSEVEAVAAITEKLKELSRHPIVYDVIKIIDEQNPDSKRVLGSHDLFGNRIKIFSVPIEGNHLYMLHINPRGEISESIAGLESVSSKDLFDMISASDQEPTG